MQMQSHHCSSPGHLATCLAITPDYERRQTFKMKCPMQIVRRAAFGPKSLQQEASGPCPQALNPIFVSASLPLRSTGSSDANMQMQFAAFGA